MRKFSRIYIEITNMCNMSCSFCKGSTRKAQFMTVEAFEIVMNQIKDYTDYIYLHVLGEPLLHPQLEALLLCAERNNKKVSITTNGTMLRDKKEILLHAQALRKISVSLHSMEPGSINSNEDYLKEVIAFAREASERSMLCELRMWNLGNEDVQNTSMSNAEACEIIFRELNIEAHERKEILDNISVKGSVTLRPKLFLGKADRFQWPSLTAEYTNQPIFCHGIRSQLAILCDGTVVPCCLDSEGDVNLGNIFGESLEQIIQSKRAVDLYNGFSNRSPSEELCKRCGYATRF